MITLYDIPSTIPEVVWGPNTMLSRLALEYKGIPFETTWVEYPDIEPTARALAAEPTTIWPASGKPKYTVPIIYDTNTGRSISDSWDILLYLEDTYPDAPSLIPQGMRPLMKVFTDEVLKRLDENALMAFTFPQTSRIVNIASREYFLTVKNMDGGMPIKEFEASADFEKVKAALDWIEELFKMNGGEFLVGNEFSYAEVFVGAKIHWFIVHGKESQLWKNVMSLNGGRWLKLMERVEKLARIKEVASKYREEKSEEL